ncbi:hypothetical protein ACWDTI_08815 [Gordonia sp. NPDC003424]
MRRFTVRQAVLGAALVALAGTSACATADNPTSTTGAPSAPAPAVSTRLDASACREIPDTGHVDRGGHDLRFGHGGIRIAIATPTPTPTTEPSSPDTGPDDATCYGFARWGPANPDVPPDTLLFTFKGARADGAQIEFLAGDLAGNVLPPIDSSRPTLGPLTGPITAQIGMSLGGNYYHSADCPLTITALTAQRAAAAFTCPTAARMDANPLAPDDNVSYDADGSATSSVPAGPSSAAPAVIGTPTTVSLSGWFELKP